MDASRSEDRLITRLSEYMAEARQRPLPPEVEDAASLRVLDALGAMVSGSRLKPGELAISYTRKLGSAPEAQVVGSDIVTSAANAALANGMLAHADETDDVDLDTKAHPGCSIVPTALAMAERERAGGAEMLRAVALGYDVCVRMLLAFDPQLLWKAHRSTQGIGGTFGSAATAGALARLDAAGMRYVLSYAAQQASGIFAWSRDAEHVEKAFDFGGMCARNGVTAATMVQAGFTGVRDVLEGEHNLLEAFSPAPRPHALLDGLGSRFYVATSAIKPYPVGYPIQSALDSLFALMREHRLKAGDVEHVVARLSDDGARIVNDRDMPDINAQHCLAVALLDGGVSFAATHSFDRMRDPATVALRKRIELVADPALADPRATRQAIIEVITRDGRTLHHHTRHASGTPLNPITVAQMDAKALDLMAPVLGVTRARELVSLIHNLGAVKDISLLRPLLTT